MSIIGIGTDIIEVPRIALMIEKHGELFVQRVYTTYEIGYCQLRKSANQHYAGRWAAKEAVLKAIGTGWAGGIQWTDIEVRNDVSGRPSITLYHGAKDVCEERGISDIQISISHCRTMAVAYAVAIGFEPNAQNDEQSDLTSD